MEYRVIIPYLRFMKANKKTDTEIGLAIALELSNGKKPSDIMKLLGLTPHFYYKRLVQAKAKNAARTDAHLVASLLREGLIK